MSGGPCTRALHGRPMVAALALAALPWLAQAAPSSFTVALAGGNEVPAVPTSATGSAKLTYDPATRVLTWNVTCTGLSGPATMAHFHGPAAAGTNAAPVIWLTAKGGETTGPIIGEATLTPEQAQQFSAGQWYVNVHTKDHPGGEIRGQVVPPKG